MRSGAVVSLVLFSSLLAAPVALEARQAGPSLASAGLGSAFQDVSIGLAARPAASAVTFSSSASSSAPAYGVYGDGWGREWRPRHARGGRGRSYRCIDVWAALDAPYGYAAQAGLYDPWFYMSDLYFDCIVRGPSWAYHRWHAYRPTYRHSYRPWVFRVPVVNVWVHVVDPFWQPWGPYWAYDPWAHHSPAWVVYGGHGVRVRPGPVYRQPSPIFAGTRFKESPAGGSTTTGRTAQPRGVPAAAPAASAPRTSRGVGIQAPPRRTAEGAAGGVQAPGRGTTREPSAEPGSPRVPGPAGNTPALRPGATPPVQTPRTGDVGRPAEPRSLEPSRPSRPQVAEPSRPQVTQPSRPSQPRATEPVRSTQPRVSEPTRPSEPRAEPSRPSGQARPTQPQVQSRPQAQPAPNRPQAQPSRPEARPSQPQPSRPQAQPQAPSRPQAQPAPARPQAQPAPSRPQATPARPSGSTASPRPVPPRRPGGESDGL